MSSSKKIPYDLSHKIAEYADRHLMYQYLVNLQKLDVMMNCAFSFSNVLCQVFDDTDIQRQKLAVLEKTKMVDLKGDVYFALNGKHPDGFYCFFCCSSPSTGLAEEREAVLKLIKVDCLFIC